MSHPEDIIAEITDAVEKWCLENLVGYSRESCWGIAKTVGAVVSKHQGWRPIETAPRDGTVVLLYTPVFDHHTIQGKWREHDFGGEWVDVWNTDPIENIDGPVEFTHWKPIGDLPSSAEEEG